MKTLIVGGNSGIGLAIALKMLKNGAEKIYIIGKDEPDVCALDDSMRRDFEEKVVFRKQNFISLDMTIFDDINDIDSLIITSGFGRVALFDDLTDAEVKNLLRVDLEAIALILKRYYCQISSANDFYTAVIVSICGQVVSPFFSVYGAAKAGLRFLIENLNCELMAMGSNNRILDVSPGSLKGTNFNGTGNNLSLLNEIVDELLYKMYKRETLYIPQYEEVYKEVINRYKTDPLKFGKDSYQYKNDGGRVSTKPQVIIGYLSGTFDLFHIGHLNLLRRAKEQCDYLIVSVHESGSWKGKETFIPYEERRAIVENCKYVDRVVEDFKEDSDAWDKYHYNKLFVGSDYKGTERFNKYEQMFKNKVEIVYFPYTKGTSSTQLREKLKK